MTTNSDNRAGPDAGENIIVRLWNWFWKPSARWSLGVIVIVGFVGGILFWGAFNWTIELTNTETFCISCHEMRDTVFAELQESPHYSNRTGVRASCSDCHVPKEWGHKIIRKIQATNELFHKIMGTVDTREKFEANRLEMAGHVWAAMKATNSRECRNCHEAQFMKISGQIRQAQGKHQAVVEGKFTCIDCHQGIAHKLPAGWEAAFPK